MRRFFFQTIQRTNNSAAEMAAVRKGECPSPGTGTPKDPQRPERKPSSANEHLCGRDGRARKGRVPVPGHSNSQRSPNVRNANHPAPTNISAAETAALRKGECPSPGTGTPKDP